jgi:2-dehydro-3-deoxygalactonokinase
MYIATIDCGTTNSRVYIVDENGKVLTRASQKVGVRDTAISGSNQVLKDGLREVFDRALQEAGLNVTDIRCILSSGMITSELGLIEIPHIWAPCSISNLAASLTRVDDLDVFPPSIPVYFVRGIKNTFDPGTIDMQGVGALDFMRGEEAQVAGLLDNRDMELPAIVTVLSSHTKFIPIDREQRIPGSVTTISGQVYEAVLKETFVGKSVRGEDDFDDSDYFDPAVVDLAYDELPGYPGSRPLVRAQVVRRGRVGSRRHGSPAPGARADRHHQQQLHPHRHEAPLPHLRTFAEVASQPELFRHLHHRYR